MTKRAKRSAGSAAGKLDALTPCTTFCIVEPRRRSVPPFPYRSSPLSRTAPTAYLLSPSSSSGVPESGYRILPFVSRIGVFQRVP